MVDLLIVGGGVIGLSAAYELAGAGLRVAVVDQGPLAQEASWAGAGMLPPGNPAHAATAEARLRAGSHVLWEAFSEELRETTGIDNGYRRCGGLELWLDDQKQEAEATHRGWCGEGTKVELLTGTVARDLVPGLSSETSAAVYLPEMGQIRNPRHLKALIAGCAARGVSLHPGLPVSGFERVGSRVIAAQTPAGSLPAGKFLICAGAWSRALLASSGVAPAIEPVRGQIVLLQVQPLPFKQVLCVGSRYLVPRLDGRILIGSTEERAGFDRRNTPAGIGGLSQFAMRVFPGLAEAKFERSWAGLRPGSPDGLPYLGAVPGSDNLFVAAGHFRSGLQMSPMTARLTADIILGRPPAIPLEPYACDRKPTGDPHRNSTV